MDIRGPRLRKPSEKALEFTSSMAWDGRIAPHVIRVNMAHMAALVRAGEVSPSVGARCMEFLMGASAMVDPAAKFEDFHQQLEQEAVDSLGVQTAGFLNYGKSRNDQVATAVRMELRERVFDLIESVSGFQEVVLQLVANDGAIILPGYTHLQRAQPVTLAHHFFSYFDAFQRDIQRAFELYSRVNLSPMGGAALAGTSVKVDRRFVSEMLGFGGIVANSMDAVSSRDVELEALMCAAITMLDASRLAEELILWSTAEFGFVELDDSYSASSSIMPQKKNPVFAEMVRAKTGSVLGYLVAACAIVKALPNSYNLDLQEATPQLWRALDDTIDSIEILTGALESATFNENTIAKQVSTDGSTAVGLANYLVKNHGVSFRQAHSIVGDLVRTSVETGEPLSSVAVSRLPRASSKFAGKKITIGIQAAKEVLDPGRFLGGIATEGGSNPRFIPKELKARQNELSSNRAELSGLKSALKSSERKLNATSSGIAREVKSKSEH